jgi:hypothetical protein
VLELSMNNLAALPPGIGRLSRLEVLDLSDNRLAELPRHVSGLASLRTLGLRSNSLRAVPCELGALAALSSLDLSMNHLEALPGSVTALAELQQVGWGPGGAPHRGGRRAGPAQGLAFQVPPAARCLPPTPRGHPTPPPPALPPSSWRCR